MKITIELEDRLLRAAVEAQVGVAVAAATDECIRKIVDEIVPKKMARFDPYSLLQAQATQMLKQHLGENDFSRKQKVDQIVGEAMREFLKGKLA